MFKTKYCWKVNMAFSEVGCSEIIINIEKIQDVCNPSHYLCILSVSDCRLRNIDPATTMIFQYIMHCVL